MNLKIIYQVAGAEVTADLWASDLTRRIQKTAAVKIGTLIEGQRCTEHDAEPALVVDDGDGINVHLRTCCKPFEDELLAIIRSRKGSEG